MRLLLRASVVLLTIRCIALGQTAAPAISASPIPSDLDGRWWGELHHGSEIAGVGFEFARQPDGRVKTLLWCPNLNTYGTPIAWLKFADGRFSLGEASPALSLDQGTLSGSLFTTEVTFTARRSDELPPEPELATVPPGPVASWTYHAAAGFWVTPTIADHVAFAGDAAGTFHAVSTTDGKPVWTFAAGTPLFGAAAVSGDAVYFAGDNGTLFKLARSTGAEIWRSDIGGSDFKRSLPTATATEWDYTTAAPVVDGDAVIVGSTDGSVRALDTATGKPLWQFKSGGKTRAAALVADGRVFVGSFDHFVYALDRKSGELAWRFDTGSAVTTPPVFADGKIIIGTRDRSLLFGLDVRDGKQAWADFYWFSWVESAPVLVDGRLYIGSSDSQRVRVVDPRTGKVDWARAVGGWTWGTPLVVGETVYYATGGTEKYFNVTRPSIGALDRRTGRMKWRKPLSLLEGSYISGIPGSLVYAGGKILAASVDGTLTAYPAE